MYTPRLFAVDDPAVVLDVVRRAGFGHLVVAGDDGLASTPLPFVVDDALTSLRSHLAAQNPIWREAPCDALVIVAATDAYISPGWYPSKAEHGKVVPTWNYEVVHLHGRLVAHDDPDWLGAHLRALSDHNEAAMPTPWSIDDPPDGFVEQLARGIVGVELRIDRVVAKRKLSQNRPPDDRRGVVTGLRASGSNDAARAVIDADSDDEGRPSPHAR